MDLCDTRGPELQDPPPTRKEEGERWVSRTLPLGEIQDLHGDPKMETAGSHKTRDLVRTETATPFTGNKLAVFVSLSEDSP